MKYQIISENTDGSINVGFFSHLTQYHVIVAVVGNPDTLVEGDRPHPDTILHAEAIVRALNNDATLPAR